MLQANCFCSLHELARNVQQATNTTGASSATCTTSTGFALHVELERHLSSLCDSVLLGSFRVLQGH